MSELKTEVLELAKKIKAAIELDEKTGEVKGDTKVVYDENLPEGITPEVVKTLSGYNSTFVAAGTYAVGEIAVEAFKKHSGLERVHAELPMGHKDRMEVAVDRVLETRNNLQKDENGEPKLVVKYGATRVALDVQAAHNAGQLKVARAAISEMAEAALKKM